MSSFSSLPLELVITILEYLDLKTSLACREVWHRQFPVSDFYLSLHLRLGLSTI